jgi:catechol 2,3-dioxygenase-like lactoylglutathione lyase family enzyme
VKYSDRLLGRFLEFSIPAPDIRASLDFYGKLGFSEAEVGEAWTHPYAVLTDGRICLGLHQQSAFAPSTTFVMPDLLQHLDGFAQLVQRFEFRRLGNDVFNEIGWLDPSGHLIRLVEARTFSPSKRKAVDTTLCGYFREIGLPTPNPDTAKAHWEQFGFVGIDEPDAMLPHVSCTSDTVDIGLYEPAHLQGPTLIFDVDDFNETLARLDANGVKPDGRLPAPLRRMSAAVLTAPEGTSILITAA